MQSKDKRTGRKVVTERLAVKDVGLPSYSLSEAIEYVIRVKQANNLKKRTLDGYRVNMDYFVEWVAEHYGELAANDVTIDMLREYVLWCAQDKEYYGGHPFKEESGKGRRGLSASSVNVRIRVLRTFFATMYAEDVIDTNPAANLSLMRQDIDTVEPLSDDELQRLLKAPDQRYYAQFRDYVAIILILDTGIRLNEICALEKAEVNFTAKQIVLPAVKNKNRKNRTLPLSTESARLLRQLIKESEQHFDTSYVFITNYGEPVNEKTIQKALSKYAEKAKIAGRVTPHVLRHNFATMAAHNGMSVFHLQKILGHADISTTRKYVQIGEEELSEQHAKFSPLTRLVRRR